MNYVQTYYKAGDRFIPISDTNVPKSYRLMPLELDEETIKSIEHLGKIKEIYDFLIKNVPEFGYRKV